MKKVLMLLGVILIIMGISSYLYLFIAVDDTIQEPPRACCIG